MRHRGPDYIPGRIGRPTPNAIRRSSILVATRVIKILSHIRGPWVLDVGCAAAVPEVGSHYWLHGQLREKFPNVVGIDISEKNIETLRSVGFRDVFVANAETFSLSQKFDTIVAGELIEHLSNPELFLARSREHLAPGGRLVITTPNVFSLLYFLYAFLKFPKTCSNPEHTCWFCPQTLQELSRRAGFRTVHWEYVADYRTEGQRLRYRTFASLTSWLPRLLPDRLRCNTILFVLEPPEQRDKVESRKKR